MISLSWGIIGHFSIIPKKKKKSISKIEIFKFVVMPKIFNQFTEKVMVLCVKMTQSFDG